MKKLQLVTEDKRLSQIDRMIQLLKKKRGQRVSAMDLYLVSGSLSIATQCSFIRRHHYLNVINKTEPQKNGIKWSFYKLTK